VNFSDHATYLEQIRLMKRILTSGWPAGSVSVGKKKEFSD